MEPFEKWKVARHNAVKGPQGDLSLIALHEINAPKSFEGIPGVWEASSNPDMPGLKLTVSRNEQIHVNGCSVEGSIGIIADKTVVDLGNSLTAMATSQPGSLHLLAIWDEDSDALSQFKEIDTYPYDPNWIIQGTFKMNHINKTLHFSHTQDQSGRARIHQSPGEIIFTINGDTFHVRPFVSDNCYVVVFNDQTSGKETYGMGRMLVVTPNVDGTVLLDFNRAFLPPCAFSPYFNCPMPPFSNRFPFAIKAGEKRVLQYCKTNLL